MVTVRSAINSCKEQLFLDKAVGEFLDAVADNLGIARPVLGFSRANLWRAVVRRLALDTKLIENVFRDLMTIMLGPKTTAVTVLSENAVILDDVIFVSNPENIPQYGTLTIDPGLLTEEIVEYSFRNLSTGEVNLTSPLTKVHTALNDNAFGNIAVTALIGATSLTLDSTVEFPEPTGGVLVPVLLGAGTVNEEVVLMSNNNKITGVLTVSTTTKDHFGPKMSFVSSEILSVSPGKNIIELDDVSNFPSEGYLRITENGGATTEDVEYYLKNYTENKLVLSKALVNTYTTAFANLLVFRETVKLSQVKVDSIDWDIWQTEPNVLRIYIPIDLFLDRQQDASFIHNVKISSASSTLAAGASIGDKEITLVNADTFPRSGIVLIDSTEYVGYGRIDRYGTTLLNNDLGSPGIPAGSTELFLNNVGPMYQASQELGINTAIIDRGATDEVVTIQSFNVEENKITLTAGTVSSYYVGTTIELGDPNKIYLSRGLTGSYLLGDSVVFYQPIYAGTNLEDGLRYSGDRKFQGPYCWDLSKRIRETASTTLNENLAGPQRLLVSQEANRTCLEVNDASLLNTDFQEVRIGRGLAGDETIGIVDVVLRRDISGATLTSSPLAGATTFTVSVSSLPDANGYRLFIDADSPSSGGEEVVIVRDFNSSTNTVVLESPLQYDHTTGDKIWLLADVIVTDPIAYAHIGRIPYADRTKLIPGEGTDWSSSSCVGVSDSVALVEEVRSYISVVSSSSFISTGGKAFLNFGKAKQANSQLSVSVASGVGSLSLLNGSNFPTSNFVIRIGGGNRTEETLIVSSRTGNTLTLSGTTLFSHEQFEDVVYVAGKEEILTYTETSTGRLESSTGFRVETDHAKGEIVSDSPKIAFPSVYGDDHPFYLPSRWEDRYEFLFDLARAAGVKILFVSDL